MSRKVIQFEHVGKQYRLGTIGTGTLSQDLNRWWARLRGKDDPYLKVGETNDRTQRGTSGFVWALRDIDFSVEQGDVVGIIGKNGAGKSTLLKILSRVTSPTVGRIGIKGRIASLLEVGTGFHPEMTGRENIFMNGSIMGMTKAEIRSKLDEIVDFAGVAKYLDTPVKRYSSGMMVRLGFAIAAHLEPEILVVDEVLAVGDAEFQKKAIGKMQDVSRGEGRTVLFVSHNMAAVKSLCTKGVVLHNGQLAFRGDIDESLQYYLNTGAQVSEGKIIEAVRQRKSSLTLKRVLINGTEDNYSTLQAARHTLEVRIEGHTAEELKTDLMLVLRTKDGLPLATFAEGHYKGNIVTLPAGDFTLVREIQLPRFLSQGQLYCDLMMHHPMVEWQLQMPSCCVLDCEGYQEGFGHACTLLDMGIAGLEQSQHKNGGVL